MNEDSIHDVEAALLGHLLVDAERLDTVTELVGPEDFLRDSHAAVFRAISDTVSAGHVDRGCTDIHRVHSLLESRGVDLPFDRLVSFAESSGGSSGLAKSHADMVREASRRRQLAEAAENAVERLSRPGQKLEDILDKLGGDIFRLSSSGESVSIEQMSSVLQRHYEWMERRAESGEKLIGHSSGFKSLDDMLSGICRGYIVIAARPSVGKTAFAMNIAERMSERGAPAGIFSLEMSRDELASRMISSRSGVPIHSIRHNELRGDDWSRMQQAIGELGGLGLQVDDTPGLRPMQLRVKARQMARTGCKAFVVDYIQLMECDGENRQQQVTTISRQMKALSRELDAPLIVLSQLNRSGTMREDKRPQLSDLRESGSIEQDADVVIMLHREDYGRSSEWMSQNPEKVGETEVIVRKQRNGPVGTVKIYFDGATCRFTESKYGETTGHKI